ncbi:MAG TPA: CDP-alcohol phosphatidyltransferase family protein [candidate division Zixibacteria bacterium]|nr:CDP-alcohol phosphatidyltransferase family protein [candidate division Zixibacteria bacterium]
MHYKRRAAYEARSEIFGKVCVKLGLTPNVLTAFSFGFSVLAGTLFWKQEFLLGTAALLLNALTDMLDGATARAGKMGTVFGGVLDHVSDRYAEFFVLMGILLSGAVAPGWVLFAQFGIIIASYTRAAAESIGGMKTCAVGIAGRLEKFIFLVAGAILQSFIPQYQPLLYALILMGIISYITSIQRLIYAKKQVGDRQEEE